MIDFVMNVCNLLRPILFLLLLGYFPLKFGISFDVAGKPPSADEIRESRRSQMQHILSIGIINIFLLPFRLLVIAYFSIWLIVDKALWFFIALFLFSLLPLYFK